MTDQATLTTVTLDEPIVRGEETIGFLQLRKPKAGELRGLSMVDLIKLEVSALQELLPRITSPSLTSHEVADLSAADLFALANEIAVFLLPKGMQQASLAQ